MSIAFCRLLVMASGEILKLSAADYIKTFDPLTNEFPELGELQREYGNKADGPSSHVFADYALKKLLHDPDVPRGCDPNSPEYETDELGGSGSC
ncbi:hypothetical protein HID58_008887 [Brassica napus]|uniref:Uncharacterized protein n=1 Tax=Brassica napus TaxID=3708 RepID=A0ABQ8DQX5_BRANA|nr:hypothetical protein HID58_008887 [Brassica napus]